MTYDRDLAHKIFGYRLKFLREEMKLFGGKGKPVTVYEHYSEECKSSRVKFVNKKSDDYQV